jgi:hypothetical protein
MLQRDATTIAFEVGALTLIGIVVLQRDLAIGLVLVAVQMLLVKLAGQLFSRWA